MNKRKKRLYFPPLTVGIFVVLAVILSVLVTNAIHGFRRGVKPPTELERYEAAVTDALIIDEDEIRPVVSLYDEKTVSVNIKGQVLLIVWHDTPYLYSEGSAVTTNFGTVWAYADGELIEWYKKNPKEVDDGEGTARFEKLLGLPPKSGRTHFSGVWVWLEDIRRPAYVPEVENDEMRSSFLGEPDDDYKQWFDKTIIDSYFDGRRPWTRLGYTYDWDEKEDETASRYGLSEFIITEGSDVTVEFTRANSEFWDWLKSTAADDGE